MIRDFPWLWAIRDRWCPYRTEITVRNLDPSDLNLEVKRWIIQRLEKNEEVWVVYVVSGSSGSGRKPTEFGCKQAQVTLRRVSIRFFEFVHWICSEYLVDRRTRWIDYLVLVQPDYSVRDERVSIIRVSIFRVPKAQRTSLPDLVARLHSEEKEGEAASAA